MLFRLSHSSFLSLWMHLLFMVQVLLLTSSFASAAVVKPSANAAASSSYAGEIAYQKVADSCHRLLQDTTTDRSRKDWLKAADELDQVYQKYPRSRTAPACLYLSARLRLSMYQRFRQPADQDQAVSRFHNVVTLFPQSSEAADALYAIAEIEQINGNLRDAAKTYYKLTQSYPFSPRRAQAEDKLSQLIAIARSLAARKNGHHPPTASTAKTQEQKKFPPPTRKPTSEEPVWEPIFSEPKPVVNNRKTVPAQKITTPQVKAPALTTAKVPSPGKPTKPTTAPAAQTASQKREWTPVFPSTATSRPSQENQQKTATRSHVFTEKKVNTTPPKSVSLPKAPVSRRAEPEPDTVPKINFSELKIARPDDSVLPQEHKEPVQPVTKSPAPPPKKVAKVEEKPIQKEEKEEKSFWERIVPDFMLSSDDEEDEKPEQKPAKNTVKAEQVKKTEALPQITLSVKERKPEPATKIEASEKPQPVAPKVAENVNKPEKTDTSKIVVSALQIAAMEPTRAPVSKKENDTPKNSPPKETEPEKPVKAPLADLRPIQQWSSDRYSRVAISTSAPVLFHAALPDRSSDQPELHIDFEQSHLPAEIHKLLEIKNSLINSIQAEQITPETVRVSVKLVGSAADYKIFSLNDPFRVVIDLRSLAETKPEKIVAQAEKEKEKADIILKTQSKTKSSSPDKLTLAQQLGLGIKRIVIDPGHGGKDTGAIAFGLREKDIVLKVAKRVRKILERENYEVFLTRDKDVFIPLEERTAIANTKGADLFLSIHVNAHPKSWVKGVETFYLNLAANPEAMRVAALENATSSRSMSEMKGILTDLMKNTKINESSQLAEFIQTSMAEGLRSYKTRSLGVKKAPFYVLIGAQMPAALSEISFLTNKKEAKLLKNDRYLQTISEQIATGVIAYIEHRRTTATAALNMPTKKEEM